jgi:hypothetical protein
MERGVDCMGIVGMEFSWTVGEDKFDSRRRLKVAMISLLHVPILQPFFLSGEPLRFFPAF